MHSVFDPEKIDPGPDPIPTFLAIPDPALDSPRPDPFN